MKERWVTGEEGRQIGRMKKRYEIVKKKDKAIKTNRESETQEGVHRRHAGHRKGGITLHSTVQQLRTWRTL